jgi:hypothetical protein
LIKEHWLLPIKNSLGRREDSEITILNIAEGRLLAREKINRRSSRRRRKKSFPRLHTLSFATQQMEKRESGKKLLDWVLRASSKMKLILQLIATLHIKEALLRILSAIPCAFFRLRSRLFTRKIR